jgi:hypothetical protein
MTKQFKSSPRVIVVDKFGDSVAATISMGVGVVDMSTESGDYRTDSLGTSGNNTPKYFFVIPEAAGVIVVELYGADEGDTYTITAVQIDANLGNQMNYKIRKVVKTGTTATFSAVW